MSSASINSCQQPLFMSKKGAATTILDATLDGNFRLLAYLQWVLNQILINLKTGLTL